MATLAMVVGQLAAAATDAPVIGILTVPTISGDCITMTAAERRAPLQGQQEGEAAALGSCFDSLYPQWIEAAGGRVVPIRYDAPATELERIFRSVNGVLFTGGETDIRLLNSTYMRAAARLFNLASNAHDSGDHVPLWGTCMGFQTLAVLAAGRADALTSRGVPKGEPGFDSDGINLPLQMAAGRDGSSSVLWSNFAQGLQNVSGGPASTALPEGSLALHWLATENITTNLHHDGVEPSSFARIPALKSFFNIISTNRDLKGREFVSTMEAASGAPIYGTQWHPERNQFQFSLSAGEDNIEHSTHALVAMQTTANFFVAHEARRNAHAFASEAELAKALLYNDQPHGRQGDSYRAYMFKPWAAHD